MKWTNKGHQFDHIAKHFEGKKKVYIYGAGENGEKVYNNLKFLNCVKGFIDSNIDKQKSSYLGEKVYAIEEILPLKKDYIIVIAISDFNIPAATKKLVSTGYVEGIDIFTGKMFLNFYLPIYAMYVHDKVYFESVPYILTRDCNLNCEKCLAFKPYIHKVTEYSFEQVKKDIDTFFSCVDFVGLFAFAGGESFLYSNYKQVIEYIGENYRQKIGQYSITTNATINLSDALCEVMKKYNMFIYTSNYTKTLPGLKQKYDDFLEKLSQYNIEHEQITGDKWIDLCVFTTNNSSYTENQLINHYDACNLPFIELRDQKIYSCAYESFAIVADLHHEDENSFYDLRKFDSSKKKELVEFRLGFSKKGYVDFCKRCSGFLGINKNFVEVAKQVKPKNV